MHHRFIVVTLCALAMCFTPSARAGQAVVSAAEAIERSIASPSSAIGPVWVEMDVCGSGAHRGRGFLNSMEDYRDRQSFNVELPPLVRGQLAVIHGGDPVETLVGKRVQVFGPVRQVRINLFQGGVATGQFYFQTQLQLTSPTYLRVVYEGDEPVPADCNRAIV